MGQISMEKSGLAGSVLDGNQHRRRRTAICAIADALMERRAMDGDEVAAILAQHPTADVGERVA